MAILFSACVSYSVMHVFVCLLARTIRCRFCFSSFASLSYDCHFFLFILFLFRYLIVFLFLLFPADIYPKNRDAKNRDVNYLEKISNRFIALSNTTVQNFNSVVGNGELAH